MIVQVQFTLPHPKIHGTVNPKNKEVIDVDVTIKNPLKKLALTDVTVDVDSDFGDRTLTPFEIAPGTSETKSVQIATGPQGTHCAVFGVEAKEIFGLGWEGLLCYDVSADGSVKFVVDG